MDQPSGMKDPVLPVVLILLFGGIAAGFYYWLKSEPREPQPVTAPPVAVQPAAEPQIRHPIPRAESQDAKPLPPLAESDEALQEAARGFLSKESLERFFNMNSIVRRFVVTVEDLPRKKIGQKYNLAKPVAGSFIKSGSGESIYIGTDNYRRYAPYISIAEAVDTKKIVAAYVYFYPLFQEEYKNLGYPKRYFNDRLVETIDDLLAAPEIKAPIKIVQPKVIYEYADPNLEALSAGQKIMIRIGPENAARVKAKLQEIRRELTAVR